MSTSLQKISATLAASAYAIMNEASLTLTLVQRPRQQRLAARLEQHWWIHESQRMVHAPAVLLRVPMFRHRRLLRRQRRRCGDPSLDLRTMRIQFDIRRSGLGTHDGKHWLESHQRWSAAVQVNRLRTRLQCHHAKSTADSVLHGSHGLQWCG